MKPSLLNNMDFLAGLLMIAVGGCAFWMALDYPFGSALRMGPGYFPRVLAGLLIAFGLYVGQRGLRHPEAEAVKGVWGWKALIWISIAFVVFGWVMEKIGFIPSLVVLFFLSAYAGHEFKLKEVTILSVLMIFFAWAVFIKGLGLPFRLFWWD